MIMIDANVMKFMINTKPGGSEIPSSYSPWLVNVVKRLLSCDMKQRPTTADLLADPEIQAELVLVQVEEESPAVQAQLESATKTLNEAHEIVTQQVACAHEAVRQVQAYVESAERVDVRAQER